MNRFQRFVMRAPIGLYRVGLGGVLGSRFLLLEHVGRNSEQLRSTALEVLETGDDGAPVIASGFGESSQWYKNVSANHRHLMERGARLRHRVRPGLDRLAQRLALPRAPRSRGGRSRAYIFVQMLILVVLAVYAGHAADEDGQGFAITYAVLLAVLTLQWYGVRRVDAAEWSGITGRYIGGMAVLASAMVVSAFLDDDARLALWAVLVVVFVIGAIVQAAMAGETRMGMVATDSMSEQLGLFTIIVLGEVVVGVVDGLSETERDTLTIVTGLLALCVGFGFWWNYFDFAGRRVPRTDRPTMVAWLNTHLPMAAAIAAAGAGMIGLIEHAGDGRTPPPTVWLISGAAALLLVCLAALVMTIDYDADDAPLARPVSVARRWRSRSARHRRVPARGLGARAPARGRLVRHLAVRVPSPGHPSRARAQPVEVSAATTSELRGPQCKTATEGRA